MAQKRTEQNGEGQVPTAEPPHEPAVFRDHSHTLRRNAGAPANIKHAQSGTAGGDRKQAVHRQLNHASCHQTQQPRARLSEHLEAHVFEAATLGDVQPVQIRQALCHSLTHTCGQNGTGQERNWRLCGAHALRNTHSLAGVTITSCARSRYARPRHRGISPRRELRSGREGQRWLERPRSVLRQSAACSLQG